MVHYSNNSNIVKIGPEEVNAKATSNGGEAVSYRLTKPSVDSGHEATDSTASPAAGAATTFTTAAPSSANILNDLKSITQKIARLGSSSSTPQLPTFSSLDHQVEYTTTSIILHMISTSNVVIEQGPSTSSRQRPLTVGISLNDDTLSSISTGNHSPVSDYGAGGLGAGGYGSTSTYPQVCPLPLMSV